MNSGTPWPERCIAVALLPASMPCRGGSSDLAIAIAVVTATAEPSMVHRIPQLQGQEPVSPTVVPGTAA
jgi:predicted ATPase with chaperone activity